MRPRTSWRTINSWVRTTFRDGEKPCWRQWPEIVWMLGRYGLTAPEYFNYGFHERRRSIRSAEEYFGQYWLWPKLKRLSPPQDRLIITNKLLFHLTYQAHGLPLPKLLCWSLPGHKVVFDVETGLQSLSLAAWIDIKCPPNLVIKPVVGEKGKGVYVFPELSSIKGKAEGRTGDRDGLSLREVLGRLDTSAPEGMIVQEYIRQCPELSRLNEGRSVNTVRIVTFRRPGGEIRILGAALRYAVNAGVDNWHMGGVACPVELGTGRIGTGMLLSPGPRVSAPRTVPVEWTIPHWPTMLALAREAASIRPGQISAGWDITCTMAGPLIIEGNPGWDPHLIQNFGVGLLDGAMRLDLRHYGVRVGRLHR